MATSTKSKDKGAKRSTMGASPDATLNETPNPLKRDPATLLPTTHGIRSAIPTLDDLDLEDIQSEVEGEILSRSPEGQGAALMEEAYGPQRRAYNTAMREADYAIRMVVGGLMEVFDNRRSCKVKSQTGPTVMDFATESTCTQDRIVIKDPKMGCLEFQVYAWSEDPTAVNVDVYLGRFTRKVVKKFSGSKPSETIDNFAAWAATHR